MTTQEIIELLKKEFEENEQYDDLESFEDVHESDMKRLNENQSYIDYIVKHNQSDKLFMISITYSQDLNGDYEIKEVNYSECKKLKRKVDSYIAL